MQLSFHVQGRVLAQHTQNPGFDSQSFINQPGQLNPVILALCRYMKDWQFQVTGPWPFGLHKILSQTRLGATEREQRRRILQNCLTRGKFRSRASRSISSLGSSHGQHGATHPVKSGVIFTLTYLRRSKMTINFKNFTSPKRSEEFISVIFWHSPLSPSWENNYPGNIQKND